MNREEMFGTPLRTFLTHQTPLSLKLHYTGSPCTGSYLVLHLVFPDHCTVGVRCVEGLHGWLKKPATLRL
jgi:hypothetical protein